MGRAGAKVLGCREELAEGRVETSTKNRKVCVAKAESEGGERGGEGSRDGSVADLMRTSLLQWESWGTDPITD